MATLETAIMTRHPNADHPMQSDVFVMKAGSDTVLLAAMTDSCFDLQGRVYPYGKSDLRPIKTDEFHEIRETLASRVELGI